MYATLMDGLISREYLPYGPQHATFLRYPLHAALFIKISSHQTWQTPHEYLLIPIYMRVVAEPEQSMHSGLTLTATCIWSLVRTRALAFDQHLIHNEVITRLWGKVTIDTNIFSHAFGLPSFYLGTNDTLDSRLHGVPTDAYTMVSRPSRYSEAFG
jgi:hypothetical protein